MVQIIQQIVSDGSVSVTPATADSVSLTVGGTSGLFGEVWSFDPLLAQAAIVTTTNQAVYQRCVSGGTITKVGFHVAVQSGNISVGLYRNNGLAGPLGAPGLLLATTGSVACPAVGYGQVVFPNPITLQAGDWLAFAADNAVASFMSLPRTTLATSALWNGRSGSVNAAFPIAGNSPAMVAGNGGTSGPPCLIGLP